ncbi:MAG: phosphoribosylanthranilate isomerase [Bacteroidales bacterium]|nr:phosphoribosylanthranilate isomerase [Bacteroidales bacterium]
MKIKICGLRDNFAEVLALKPDFAGLIFYPKSPRYVGNSNDESLKQKLTSDTKKVGVFVNETADRILEMVTEYHLDLVQLHGSESPEFCAKIRQSIPVIKAFGITTYSDLAAVSDYSQVVDFLLFDTKTSGFGGSGKKFDWDILHKAQIPLPFLLSGGISADDIPTIKALTINNLVGVDLNSKFEIAPTLKNTETLKNVINILQK